MQIIFVNSNNPKDTLGIDTAFLYLCPFPESPKSSLSPLHAFSPFLN